MSFLLDTHVFLWWIMGDARFPKALADELSMGGKAVYLSVASLWEMAIKHKLGKLELSVKGPFDDFILRQVQLNRIELLPLHAPHVLGTLHLPPHHRDPFDRVLIAQAKAENLQLVSRDPQLKLYPINLYWPQ